MKKIAFVVLMAFISCDSKTTLEEAKLHLSEDITAFMDAINTKDYHAQVDFFPESCLMGKSKDEVAQEMKEFAETGGMSEFTLGPGFRIDTLVIEHEKYYARIYHDMFMEHDLSFFSDSDSMEMSIDNLKSVYGADNVTYDGTKKVAACKTEILVYGYSFSGEEWLIFAHSSCTAEFIPSVIRIDS